MKWALGARWAPTLPPPRSFAGSYIRTGAETGSPPDEGSWRQLRRRGPPHSGIAKASDAILLAAGEVWAPGLPQRSEIASWGACALWNYCADHP